MGGWLKHDRYNHYQKRLVSVNIIWKPLASDRSRRQRPLNERLSFYLDDRRGQWETDSRKNRSIFFVADHNDHRARERGRTPIEKRRGCSWEMLLLLRGTNSKTTLSPVICFWLGNTEGPSVELFELNTLSGTKTALLTSKRYSVYPTLLILESPPGHSDHKEISLKNAWTFVVNMTQPKIKTQIKYTL